VTLCKKDETCLQERTQELILTCFLPVTKGHAYISGTPTNSVSDDDEGGKAKAYGMM
jgi:hypothetical protein